MEEARVRCLAWEDAPEEGEAAHFSIFAWRIPWTEQPGRLQSIVSHSRTQLKQPGSQACRLSLVTIGSFPGKESACNAGEPGSILGSGRSDGEGIGYPLQYFGASLVAQLVKNPPAMRAT